VLETSHGNVAQGIGKKYDKSVIEFVPSQNEEHEGNNDQGEDGFPSQHDGRPSTNGVHQVSLEGILMDNHASNDSAVVIFCPIGQGNKLARRESADGKQTPIRILRLNSHKFNFFENRFPADFLFRILSIRGDAANVGKILFEACTCFQLKDNNC
jgi:hypothetical protein